MAKLKPSEFEYANLTKNKLDRIEAAIQALSKKYQEIISDKMQALAARQGDVTKELKIMDKEIETAASSLQKTPDYEDLENCTSSLRTSLVAARKSLDNVVGSLHSLDQQLPPSDRLVKNGDSNKNQYPHLYELMEMHTLLQPRIDPAVAAATSSVETAQSTLSRGSTFTARQALETISTKSDTPS